MNFWPLFTQGRYPREDCILVSEKAIFWLFPEDTERESMETDPSESLVWLECLDLFWPETPDTDDRTVELWLIFLKKPSPSPAGGDCW